MKSAFYDGWVRHRRFAPRPHAFRYGLHMAFVDLEELWPLDGSVPNELLLKKLARGIRREEHFGEPGVRLDHAARALVAERLGLEKLGPVRMLTHPRTAGFRFNPVSFLYCFDEADTRVEAIVSEVHNTPWGETHCYVQRSSEEGLGRFSKEFHVSPFMGMDQRYAWRFEPPGDNLVVHMESFEREDKVLDATLVMRRRPLTAGEWRRLSWRHPLMTHRVIAGIYFQALKLWRKGVPYQRHPSKNHLPGVQP
jgi:DUF1365 family protein